MEALPGHLSKGLGVPVQINRQHLPLLMQQEGAEDVKNAQWASAVGSGCAGM